MNKDNVKVVQYTLAWALAIGGFVSLWILYAGDGHIALPEKGK